MSRKKLFTPLINARRLVMPSPPLHASDRPLTVAELAAHFHLSHNVVVAWTRMREFPRGVLTARGAVYALDEVMRWLKARP